MGAEAELAAFVAKFAPPMQDLIRGCRTRLQALFPDAVQLVWDNYNFLVIAFGPTTRPSEAVFSLAAQRSGIALCLQDGVGLEDPQHLLRGSGVRVRTLRLQAADDLDGPAVRALLEEAATRAPVPMSAADGPGLVIRSVSAKQRPRR